MAVNKVVLGEDTLIDLTADTVSADKLSKGVTAHDMAGEPIVGTMETGAGKEYTFTDGLTETDGTVKWNLNDRIEAGQAKGSISIGRYYDTTSMGNNIISGVSGVAIGGSNTIYKPVGIAVGFSNSVKGAWNVCLGNNLTSQGALQFIFGENNIINTGTTDTYNRNTYVHIVGNGTSYSSRSNAYTLDWQGNGTFAGTVSSATGADYAEYFEWKDGNPNNEDRVGYIVTLDGDKIVKANAGDDVLGICSGTAMVLGDSAEWNWSKRYLTDDFGRIIYEDRVIEHEAIYNDDGELIKEAWTEHIHAPKQNPEYDASQPYVKRADRPEWQIVGMMGKIYVRDDGSCVVNGYADVKDGIATKANGKTNMRVMERVSDNIVRILMK